MSSGLAGLVRAGGAAVIAVAVTGCGGGSSSSDAVSTALQMPGVRTVVVPKQHNDLTLVVPPCTPSSGSGGAGGVPQGANNALPSGKSKTVNAPPCTYQQSSG